MSEAPLLIQGYLKDLTKSEVHAIMAGGFATVAGVLDAAVKGVTAGIQIVLGIIANVIAFIAFVAFLNGILTWIGDMVGVPDVTFVNIMGYIFIPLAWVMGVEWEQCGDVAKLVGLKTMVNEFVAYQELGVLKRAGILLTEDQYTNNETNTTIFP
uniref:Concentrative nucleoside transporter C-terminal domain-containing protein n=1 Tax=Timema cristinae TaxID=61476 RepID=A0A7R9DDT6_TIMCR|nr:unnamed protein product [Timema cristinae]